MTTVRYRSRITEFSASAASWALKFVLLILFWFSPSVSAQNLGVDVEIDLAMAALGRAIETGNHAGILDQIDLLREIDPALTEGELLYFEANSAKETDDLDRAEAALIRFLSNVGRQSVRYDDALALMLDLEPLLEAQAAEEAQLAEAERQAERQRQQEVAAAQAQERLRAAEPALNLSAAEIRHIRWILYRHAGEFVMPENAPHLVDMERDYLHDSYLPNVGIRPSRYLTAEIARHFRSVEFVPAPPTVNLDGYRKIDSGDWTLTVTQTYCWIETPATHFTPGAVFQHPKMEIIAYRPGLGTGSGFDMNLARPHPFHADRQMVAMIDGRTYPLSVVSNRVWPYAPGASPTSNVVTKAIRAADSITIKGISRATDEEITVSYSAMGFTRAFTLMTEYCNRPGLLWWIE